MAFVTVPAILIPAMLDDWECGTIRQTQPNVMSGGLPMRTRWQLDGYEYDHDHDLTAIAWATDTDTDDGRIVEPTGPAEYLTVWVDHIPDELQMELA